MNETYSKTYYVVNWSDDTTQGVYDDTINTLVDFPFTKHIFSTYEEAQKHLEEVKAEWKDELPEGVFPLISKLTCTFERIVKE